MTPSSSRAVAVYARASRDPNDQRISVDRQVARCQAKAAELFPGAEVLTFRDNDLSASDPTVVRPQYEAFLAAIRRGEVDEVVVHEQSRFTRQPSQWDDLVVTLTRAGITKVHTVQQGTIGVEEGNRLVGRIMNVIDAEESERVKARVRAAHDQLAREGRPVGGRTYGYRYHHGADGKSRPERVVVPEEAGVIRRITEELLAGYSAQAVADRLNEDGVPTPRGAPIWRIPTILHLARNPHIAGLRTQHGQVVGPARWDPIISPERFEAVGRALRPGTVLTKNGARRPRSGAPPGRSRRWLLTGGIARCGRCGAPMAVGAYSRAGPAYRCTIRGGDPNACGRVGIQPAEVVEELVTEAVLELLADPQVAAHLSDEEDPERAVLAEEVAKAEAVMLRAAERYGAGEITEEEWEVARAPAAARAESARARLRALTPAQEVELPTVEVMRSQWDDLPLRARQEVLRRLLVAVWIDPSDGRRPLDPRVRVLRRLRLERRVSTAKATSEADEDWAPWLAAQPWKAANTPRHPHAYLLANKATDRDTFRAACRWVNRTGKSNDFVAKRYKYAEPGDGYRYWVSSAAKGRVIMLNRTEAWRPYAGADEGGQWWRPEGQETQEGQLRLDV